jgi:hypothetical protein
VNVVCTTGVKFIAFLRKIVTLGYASCDNASPLEGNVELYSNYAKIIFHTQVGGWADY